VDCVWHNESAFDYFSYIEKMASEDAAKELRDLRQCKANYEQDLKRSSLAYEQLKDENEQLTVQMETLMKENTAKWEVSSDLIVSKHL